GLGLGEYLGEEPRPEPSAPPRRLLPSAQVLEELVARARTWQSWGVPALALRFFRQASTLKPEFVPAQIGIAQSLLQLGLVPEGEAAFRAILLIDRNNLDARIGLATAQGVGGDIAGEIASFRALLTEDPDRIAVRAHLVAALAAHHRWADLRTEVDLLLRRVPEDPRLRLLKALALEHSGEGVEATAEKERARRLGLRPDAERQIYHELGLLAPSIPAPPPAAETPPAPRAEPAAAPAVPAKAPAARRSSRAPARPRKAAPRSKPARRSAPAVRARRKAQ
ncbi:MAG TPA: hypothetical protein VGU43_02115, partial [Thermoplasmata archaeon]|nr:hypothetical protein [Thermoplasmata archaeon]